MKKIYLLFLLFIFSLSACSDSTMTSASPPKPPITKGVKKYLPENKDNWKWTYQLQAKDGTFITDNTGEKLEGTEQISETYDSSALIKYNWQRISIDYASYSPPDTTYVQSSYPQGVLQVLDDDLALLIKDEYELLEIVDCISIPNIDFTTEQEGQLIVLHHQTQLEEYTVYDIYMKVNLKGVVQTVNLHWKFATTSDSYKIIEDNTTHRLEVQSNQKLVHYYQAESDTIEYAIILLQVMQDTIAVEGEQWDAGTDGYRDIRGMIESTDASVTLPAGQFNNCVLVRYYYERVENIISRIWFAPDYGIIREKLYEGDINQGIIPERVLSNKEL